MTGTNYVYWHRDPTTLEIIYVGHGTRFRAWTFTKQHRSEEHYDYLSNLYSQGYLPDDWVVIVQRQLSKSDACSLERDQIKMHRPRFNKNGGEKLLKVTPEVLEKASALREQGLSYAKLSAELGLAEMTIHRALAGKSPALERLIAREDKSS